MNPDFEDPNNHVPPVSPGDDWGDLDDSRVPDDLPGLPPRRPDRGIPAKKDVKPSHLNHHAPKLKLHEDSTYSPLEPRIGAGKKQTEPPQDESPATEKPVLKKGRKTAKKAARKTTKKTAKKAAGETSGKTAKNTAGKSAAKGVKEAAGPQLEKAAPAVSVSTAEDAGEERIVLPPAQGQRRFRVNEIDPTREVSERPLPKMEPKPVAGAEERVRKDAVTRSRRRHVRGERGDWGAKAAQGSLRWMLYTGLGVIALVITAVALSQRFGKKAVRGEQSFYSQIAPAEAEGVSKEAELETQRQLQEGQEEAKRIYARFATARTAEDFIGITYRAEENGGTIAENWEPMGIAADWTPGDDAVWSALEQEDLRYGVLEGGLPNFTAFTAYFRREGESLKLDWKATTGYSSADFAEMKKGRGDGSEIRAMLSPADFHTFALPEGEFRCFKLVSPDGEANLWGYTKVGGELDGKLLAQFLPSQITGEAQAEIAVILGLEPGPEDAMPSQWMIKRLVRLNWLDE